jgi:hypothetical protein
MPEAIRSLPFVEMTSEARSIRSGDEPGIQRRAETRFNGKGAPVKRIVFSRHMMPELCCEMALLKSRGRREGRVSADTHGPRAARKHAAEPQVQPIPAFPAQWFYGLYVLSSGTGLIAPVAREARQRLRKLGISTGMPGPHDFAVRQAAGRRPAPSRPSQPASTFVTTRTPLSTRRDGQI